MIGYMLVGTNNFPKAVEFFDALFASINIGRVLEEDNSFVAWATGPDAPAVCVTVPYNKEPATVGNGVMVALVRDTVEEVNALYNKAIELGASDEGKPGFRGESDNSGFYAAYFRDLDGNKFNAFCVVE